MKAEAFNMCEPSVCSFMLQLLSLANVLGCSIYSIYPEVNKAIRPLLNGYIRPAHIDSLNENVFYVMWSCDGNLDSRPGALFQPNHFCLVIQDVCIEPKNPNQNKRKAHMNEGDRKKMRATATGKQQTLFSFLKKSSKDTNDESKHKQASDHPSGSRAEASSDDTQETDTTEGKKKLVHLSRKENPQKLTQLSSRSHPRHLVGKRTAQKDITIDTTSGSQLNSNFPNRWSPAIIF